jgi:hypothetical protein
MCFCLCPGPCPKVPILQIQGLKYPTNSPIAQKHGTYPLLLLVHTEKVGDILPHKYVNLGL